MNGIKQFFTDIGEIFSKKEFCDTAAEKGLFITLFLYSFFFFITIIFTPLVIIGIIFTNINNSTKKLFKKK